MKLTEHSIVIGLIVPEQLSEQFVQVLKTFPTFRAIVRTFREEGEAVELAQEIMDQVEVMLFSGPIAYREARAALHFNIPVHFVPLTEASLYKALFRLARNVSDISKVSVDTLPPQKVERAFKDMDQKLHSVVGFDRADTTELAQTASSAITELIEFHKQQYSKQKSHLALTAVRSVAKELTELNIPNAWLMPTDQDIVVTLERALLSTESRRNKESQIVVGLLNVDHFEKLVQSRSSEHQIQKLKLDIHRLLLDYVESLDGFLTHLGGDEYLFFTTRGIFERETGGYKSIPLAQDAYKRFGISLSIGMGFGRSAGEAGTNARTALRRAKDAGGNNCFIIREDQTLIGPLEMASPIQLNLSLTDKTLLQKAEQAGMTEAYLSRLMAHAARCGKVDYTVHDLAEVLGITVRSTHRLLLQWIDHDLIAVAGLEKVAKGRPRQIYRLTFIDD